MSTNAKGIEVAEIVSDKCIGCQICVAECPVGAIEMSKGAAFINPEICIGCGKCFDVCPVDAVKFEKMAEELLSAYIAQNLNEESDAHPYSSNLTPTAVYTGRNPRSVEDDLDYENVDDTEWESEE